MTLHIVSKSPYGCNALTECLATFAEGDVLLLIEDGVYALTDHKWQAAPAGSVYCLRADAEARGIAIPEKVEGIDDTRWVELCTRHNPIVSWYK
ncbi:sulfurtransferase complex subunit TusB [Microbulbifer thermotolerans]|uniref:sulfurtransferase complex subunit TusB n=1 Tax=Microbulbifer thermotolerans TaxID=252514 RepID=UPI00224A4C0E|nr:sulfurtransferase complex subunit TusB [Microbulbifer thermotolerans]MCX2779333.1 sulfurtransferase complex subunit TusB [Microbulbifer thermotolerans]MCX2805765.1 sulfurtransferase complex subunit TusB [Microbulbifer thermotolerans]WKT62118.1 sulfurtransferase complex subunit TusB [Microbulbifer thermotolerans]